MGNNEACHEKYPASPLRTIPFNWYEPRENNVACRCLQPTFGLSQALPRAAVVSRTLRSYGSYPLIHSGSAV